MNPLRGVLLDIDGTLVDSNDAHALAWVAALAEEDIRARREDVRRLIGMGGDKLLPAISGVDAESELGKRIAERRGERFRERRGDGSAPGGKTSSDDAARSKPDPDIVLEAIARSGHGPGELVMLGDTPYDVEAATRAGVPIVALRCGGWDDAGLRGAAAIYDGPADLLARYETSLFALRRSPQR